MTDPSLRQTNQQHWQDRREQTRELQIGRARRDRDLHTPYRSALLGWRCTHCGKPWFSGLRRWALAPDLSQGGCPPRRGSDRFLSSEKGTQNAT